MNTDRPILLTQPEAAKILRIGERSLERWRVEGGGPPFVKIGRRVAYDQTTLREWLARNQFSSTAEAARTGFRD